MQRNFKLSSQARFAVEISHIKRNLSPSYFNDGVECMSARRRESQIIDTSPCNGLTFEEKKAQVGFFRLQKLSLYHTCSIFHIDTEISKAIYTY